VQAEHAHNQQQEVRLFLVVVIDARSPPRAHSPFQMLPAIARHLVFGDGVLSQSWVQAMAFARSTLCDPDGANDMQIHFIPLLGSDEELKCVPALHALHALG